MFLFSPVKISVCSSHLLIFGDMLNPAGTGWKTGADMIDGDCHVTVSLTTVFDIFPW